MMHYSVDWVAVARSFGEVEGFLFKPRCAQNKEGVLVVAQSPAKVPLSKVLNPQMLL